MTLAPQGTARLAQRLKPLLDPLFGFAMARANRRDVALDAVQETLRAALQAERQGQQWEDDDTLWAWLVGVARHKVAYEWRGLQKRGPSLGALGLTAADLAPALLDGELMPPELAGRQEVAQLCRAALSELPPRQREVLESFYRAGHSQAQIAQQLETSTKAVESMLARARTSLQAVLRRMVARPEELL